MFYQNYRALSCYVSTLKQFVAWVVQAAHTDTAVCFRAITPYTYCQSDLPPDAQKALSPSRNHSFPTRWRQPPIRTALHIRATETARGKHTPGDISGRKIAAFKLRLGVAFD